MNLEKKRRRKKDEFKPKFNKLNIKENYMKFDGLLLGLP